MISTNQFKNGSHIEVDGKIFRIIEFQHVKPGKGGAFVRTKLRRIEDGSVIDKTFRAGEKFRPVRTETQARCSTSTTPATRRSSWTTTTTSRSRSRATSLGDAMQWVLPNDEVEILFVDERPADVQVPSAVEMEVTETEPGLKGDTASGGGKKPATLESGVVDPGAALHRGGRAGPGRHPHGEYVSRAPEPWPPAPVTSGMRRSDQRRDAVFALYQRDVTGRPLEELLAEARSRSRASWPRASTPTATSSTPRSPPTPRAGRSTGSRRSSATIMRVALYEIDHREDIPAEVAIDEAVEIAKALLRRRRAGLRQRHALGDRPRGRRREEASA